MDELDDAGIGWLSQEGHRAILSDREPQARASRTISRSFVEIPPLLGTNAPYSKGMVSNGISRTSLRVGQAAEMLQVSVETLRRWESEGRLRMPRRAGGQRMAPRGGVPRLPADRRSHAQERPIVNGSARNRFPGIVTRVEKDRVAAV